MAIIELNYKRAKDTPTKMHSLSLVTCDECGVEREIRRSHAINGFGIEFCRSCSNLSSPEKVRDAIKKIENRGFLKLSGDVPDKRTDEAVWICNKKSHLFNISLILLQNERGCPLCVSERALNYENCNKLAIQKLAQFIGPIPKSEEEKVSWKCSCGTVRLAAIRDVKKCKRFRCKKCLCEYLKKINPKKTVPFDLDIKKYLLSGEGVKRRKKWSHAVYKKYDFLCQRCYVPGKKIEAHHMYNGIYIPTLQFDILNGIVLCQDCHIDFHRKYGKKANRPSDIEEFLNRPLPIDQKEYLSSKEDRFWSDSL